MRNCILIILLFIASGYSEGSIPLSFNSPADSANTVLPVSEIIRLEFEKDTLPYGIEYNRVAYEPKITVAMSGGGARGLAQIGIFKSLVENDIPVRNIVGTSMGSIIGGLLSAGYSIQEIDSLAKITDWNELILGSDTDRNELYLDQKTALDKAFFTLRLDGLNLMLPTSLSSGLKVSNFLTMLTIKAPVKIDNSFNDLLYNYRAVCTNLINGEMIILDQGSLGLALRASSSVSFVLAPVEYDSLILVDGGLVANLPVEAAVEMGGDLLFVFNTTSPLHNAEALKYPWNVADQMVSIPMKKLDQNQIDKADIVITPNLNGFTNSDFDSADSLVMAGEEAGKSVASEMIARFKYKFSEKLNEPDITYQNVIVRCENQEIVDIINKELSDNSTISKHQLYYTLYKIHYTGYFSDIQADITEDSLTTITVSATNNFPVREIIVNGVNLISEKDVKGFTEQLVNKPYNPRRLYDAILGIANRYKEKGYTCIHPVVQSIDKENGIVTVDVLEFTIDGISISGNENTNTSVILRDLPMRRNEYFDHRKIEDGLANLRSTRLFSNVELNVKNVNNRKILDVDVDERETSLIRLGLRVDNENFTQLWLDAREENILGSATELGFATTIGSRTRQYLLEHKANRIFRSYLTYKIQAYYRRTEINTYEDVDLETDRRFERAKTGEYWQLHYGGSISVGTQVGKFGKIIAEGKYQVDEIRNNFNYFGDRYRRNLNAGRLTLNIDSRDEYPFANSGFKVNTYYETAQEFFNSEFAYAKFFLDYENFFQMNKTHNFRPRFIFGYADATLPLSQQFSLGGQNMFYGLREHEFRGRQIMVASMEYRLFLKLKFLFDAYIKFRYDLGSIWGSREAIRWKDLRHGLGGAFAFDTPLGPAEFSVGRSFIIKRTLPESTISAGPLYFYFTIGYEY